MHIYTRPDTHACMLVYGIVEMYRAQAHSEKKRAKASGNELGMAEGRRGIWHLHK